MPAFAYVIDFFPYKLARRRRRRLALAQIFFGSFPRFPFLLIRHRILLSLVPLTVGCTLCLPGSLLAARCPLSAVPCSLMTEPWLRGTHVELSAVPRAVVHALELAGEDIEKWCRPLDDEALNARPADLAPVAFHLRHIVRSLDRLLTYAEGEQLRAEQLAALKAELEPGATHAEVFTEFRKGMDNAICRVRALAAADFDQARVVGRKALPTTVGGLLVHCADHTQRHTGQAITTTKLLLASRS